MMPARGGTLTTIERLRRAAVKTAERCDAILYWQRADAADDLHALPARIRALQTLCERTLEALAREGIA